jgi:3-deoxy-D-manno-octulosonic-acid transferase
MYKILFKVYNSITAVVAVILYPFFYFSKRGKVRLNERYGFWGEEFYAALNDIPVVWFHGASLGEIQGLQSIFKKLKNQYPNITFLITTTTTTGMDAGFKETPYVKLLPFDSIYYLRKALDRIKITAMVVTETEFWPALFTYLKERDVPVTMINTRISDLSFKWYRFLRGFFQYPLSFVENIFCADKVSKTRIEEIALKNKNIVLLGNSKYDTARPEIDNLESLQKSFFINTDPIIILGSIRPEEENFWFPAIKKCQEEGYTFNVIVAPRHKEKWDYFCEALERYGILYEKRTVLSQISDTSPRVILLDTFGELGKVYAFAHVAFIGASLVNIGGHNPLEASRFGTYVVMGRYNFVVAEIFNELIHSQAARFINSKEDIHDLIVELCKNPEKFKADGYKGIAVWESNLGATEKICENLTSVIANAG